MVDFVNRNYYAVLMSNNETNWARVLGFNLLTAAKAALGFFDALR